ncbi:hydroxymethylglutaryl-CoA lyase [Priestia megaterium]|uniref:hydroxymethylglutaryl-CoA lyase n=1 Tax=Priestia megaterium TaxID=1404 RepID=UPI000D506A32|nr:hydroxymethylglutaryl-CoA lyase [Priestia megaterium]PVE64475.1 hydroxymethylglutaryl-CoA lyase [Priestia megaterium]PVE79859.1 hydroxymethylglutaryl-CoA lyase [Priestia megaterium]PVE83766.1 hydroxymethylglutaryl-CoA lyase [Priestia megaterium]PVE99556.1 hydroxymethylglutaryl-CoA lyase [Priestia megaterium]
MNLPKKLKIIEIGPRDGLQNEKKNLDTDKKIELIKQLSACGFEEIEATSFVHPKWIPNLADAEAVISQTKDLPVKLFALVPNKHGYERAIISGVHGATFVLSATDSHSLKNLNRTTEESIREIESLMSRAKQDDLLARASVSTVFGCPFEGRTNLERVLKVVNDLVKIGFERIGLCDTVGIANPDQTFEYMSKLKKEFAEIEFELHFHNTYGRGLANVYAGIQAGIYSYDSSIGGLGGCPYAPGATGNISTEDLIDMLHSMKIETGVDFNKLLKVSKMVNTYFNKPLDSQLWRTNYNSCSQQIV